MKSTRLEGVFANYVEKMTISVLIGLGFEGYVTNRRNTLCSRAQSQGNIFYKTSLLQSLTLSLLGHYFHPTSHALKYQ